MLCWRGWTGMGSALGTIGRATPFLPARMFRKNGELLWDPPPVDGGGHWRGQRWRTNSMRYSSRGGRNRAFFAAKNGTRSVPAEVDSPPPRKRHDRLRREYHIDVTSISISATLGGNAYRAHVQMM